MKTSKPPRLKLKKGGRNPDQRRYDRNNWVSLHSGLLEKPTFTCEVCGKVVQVRRDKARAYRVCSMACRRAHPIYTAKKFEGTTDYGRPRNLRKTKEELMARHIKRLTSGSDLLTPQRAAFIRGRIASLTEDILKDAGEVMKGSKVWSPTQARVFATMLSKVLPDLSSSHVMHENVDRRPEEMSVDELEALVASSLRLADTSEEGVTIIENRVDPAEPGAPVLLPSGTAGPDPAGPEPEQD